MPGSRTHSKVQQGRRTCPRLLLKVTSQVGLHHVHSVATFSPDSKIQSLIEVSVQGEIKIAFEMISASLEIMFNFTLIWNRACVGQILRTIHKACFVSCVFKRRIRYCLRSCLLYVARSSCRNVTKRKVTASLQIIPVWCLITHYIVASHQNYM